MKSTQSQRIRYLVQGAMIAAIYAVLTLLAASLGWAYGPVQFRFSEALTILPAFTPAAIPGLAIGCFLSNLGSQFGIVDWVFGTLATLLAAVLTYHLRKIRVKNIPILAPLPPILCNAVIVGIEIACMPTNIFAWHNFSLAGFLSAALSVGIGELVICYGLGLPLAIALQKTGVAKRIFNLSDPNLK